MLCDLDQTLVCVDEVWIRRDGLAERGDGLVQLSGSGRGFTPVERRPGGRSAAAVARGEAGARRGTDQGQHGSDENQSMAAHTPIVDPRASMRVGRATTTMTWLLSPAAQPLQWSDSSLRPDPEAQ